MWSSPKRKLDHPTMRLCTPRKIIIIVLTLVIIKISYNVFRSLQALPDNFDMSEYVQPHLRAGFKSQGCVMENGECKPFKEAKEVVPVRGLVAHGDQFYYNGQPFRILSGEFHYFRTHPAQWGDRLLRMKASGLNTVTTYIPWNLHERYKNKVSFIGTFDLGEFIKITEKMGMKMIIRPGPYICAEWDLGGLPSWLLHDPEIKVRSTHPQYLDRVDKYFEKLMPLLAAFSHLRGGPIIAFQIENEYGSYGNETKYLQVIKNTFDNWGIEELLFTSDGSKPHQLLGGTLPGVLATVNFQKKPEEHLARLRSFQPDKPAMVGEFWTGWFDHWGESHHTTTVESMRDTAKTILLLNSSISFYMFVGGTNFDFYNGANVDDRTKSYQPTITSYDYDAPISETGDITPKFFAIRNLILELKLGHWDIPSIPENPPKEAYGMVEFNETMVLEDIFNCTKEIASMENPVFMEYLETYGGGGQGYGWILYRHEYDATVKSTIKNLKFEATFADRAHVFFNKKLIAVFESDEALHDLILPKQLDHNVIEILVENMGRCNFKILDTQRKGLNGKVFLDREQLRGWRHIPLEFGPDFLKAMQTQKWKPLETLHIPALYRAYFEIKDDPKDTFLFMKGWGKGIVIINDWNLGRYWKEGPQKTLYVPGPVLRKGMNQLVIFEVEEPQMMIRFIKQHIIS